MKKLFVDKAMDQVARTFARETKNVIPKSELQKVMAKISKYSKEHKIEGDILPKELFDLCIELLNAASPEIHDDFVGMDARGHRKKITSEEATGSLSELYQRDPTLASDKAVEMIFLFQQKGAIPM